MKVYEQVATTGVEVIRRYPELADRGGAAEAAARAWTQSGFDDPTTAKWLEARCFEPEAARSLAALGVTPEQATPRTRDGSGDYSDTIGFVAVGQSLRPATVKASWVRSGRRQGRSACVASAGRPLSRPNRPRSIATDVGVQARSQQSARRYLPSLRIRRRTGTLAPPPDSLAPRGKRRLARPRHFAAVVRSAAVAESAREAGRGRLAAPSSAAGRREVLPFGAMPFAIAVPAAARSAGTRCCRRTRATSTSADGRHPRAANSWTG